MGVSVAEVTDHDFEEQVLRSELPVVIDFWAPWCGPCRMVSPVIEQLAQDYAGKVKACKLNVDDNPQTASRYGIYAIPTVMFFKDGEELSEQRLIGVQPKSVYRQAIEALVSG